MKRNYLLFYLLCLVKTLGYSQDVSYTSLLIPDSLKTNANAVVRNELLEVTIVSKNKLKIKKQRIVTVLNKLGNKDIDLYQHYDDDTKINKLSARIYDVLGNEVKKYSENKFTDVSAVSGATLYSDNRIKYLEYVPTTYPYTIFFESEVSYSSTGFIPQWQPINNYSLSIEKSTYQIHNPLGLTIRKKENNFENYSIKNTSKENEIFYELRNQPAQKYERSSLPYFDVLPSVSVALNSFTLKDVSGEADNWKDFGKWMHENLLKDRNKLKETTKAHVKDLVKDASTNIEKAKIIYDYVQNKTRYISVQVGIGGWQPISASEVDQLGYGDCKGLTNYTKALLDAVDVPSNYTVVYAKNRRDIDKDFVSIQGNHIILNIPNEDEDVWLECTSQIMPFGFLGSFTDDRDVLVISPEGGVIKRTPAYKNETNHQKTIANIVLNENGNINANLKRVSKGIQYDDTYYLENKSEEELQKHYVSDVWDYNNNLEIKNIQLHNDEEYISFSEELEMEIKDYVSLNNNEYIFRVNVFNKFSHTPKRYRNRKQAFQISRGFLDEDEFIFTIPKGYTIPQLPSSKAITNKFGTYKSSLEKIDATTFSYKKYFLLKEGKYSKEEYSAYRTFLKTICRHENSRISLLKK